MKLIAGEYNPDVVMAAFERRDYTFVLENAMRTSVKLT
jgi:hypothetical protein